MYRNIGSIPIEVKNKVYVEYCSSKKINDIMKDNNLLRNEVLAILQEKHISPRTIIKEIEPKINDKIIIIISDTHIGSIKENIDYIRKVYDFAYIHDIHHIIHGGDLVQSDILNVSDKHIDVKEQLDYCVNIYPKYKDITTHILLGNHDYNSIVRTYNNGDLLYKILDQREDFDILGFRKAYLIWREHILSIRHEMSGYVMPFDLYCFMSFAGHHHHFYANYRYDNDFAIPTLSNDYIDSHPGFLLLEQNKQKVFLYVYSFNKYGVFLTGDSVFEKKVKKLKK